MMKKQKGGGRRGDATEMGNSNKRGKGYDDDANKKEYGIGSNLSQINEKSLETCVGKDRENPGGKPTEKIEEIDDNLMGNRIKKQKNNSIVSTGRRQQVKQTQGTD